MLAYANFSPETKGANPIPPETKGANSGSQFETKRLLRMIPSEGYF